MSCPLSREDHKRILDCYLQGRKSAVDVADELGYCRATTRNSLIKSGVVLQKGRPTREMPGDRFGSLVIQSIEMRKKKSSKGHEAWTHCLCDCGGEITIRLSVIKRSQNASCGCKRNIQGSQTSKWKGCGDITGSYWQSITYFADFRGIPFDLTIEDAWKLFLSQGGRCAISGVNLNFGKSDRRNQTASLDRKDSTKGYRIDNVQWVDKTINKLKNVLTDDEFIEWCFVVARHQESLGRCHILRTPDEMPQIRSKRSLMKSSSNS